MQDSLPIHRFGEKVSTLRKRHGMTMQALAHALGYTSNSIISDFETGRRRPTLAFALKIATFFQVSVDELVRDELDV